MASSTAAVLTISNKRNCFIKQAGLFNNHPTFVRNCPRNGDVELTMAMAPGDREPQGIGFMPKKEGSLSTNRGAKTDGDRSTRDDTSRHGRKIDGCEEAIGSVPKGFKKGSAACRWMERVDVDRCDETKLTNE